MEICLCVIMCEHRTHLDLFPFSITFSDSSRCVLGQTQEGTDTASEDMGRALAGDALRILLRIQVYTVLQNAVYEFLMLSSSFLCSPLLTSCRSRHVSLSACVGGNLHTRGR